MGRSVYADENTEAYLQELIKRKQWYVGLILGQLASQKDYVLKLARTPEPAEDEVCEELQIEGIEGENTSPKKKRPKPKSLEVADELWVATHAKQVTRMLPGGLDVIGLFTVAPAQMLKDSQAKLRQLMFAVQKAVTKNMPVYPSDSIADRILLQVDSLSSKVLCSSLDVSSSKSALRPAEWRYSGTPTRWLRVESTVAVDVTFPVPPDGRQQNLLKKMQNAVSPFCKDIWDSTTLIDGQVRPPGELLATVPESKKGKGKERETPAQDAFSVDFLMPLLGVEEIPDPKVSEVKELVSVRGITVCRAFVNWKATVKEAIEAIKCDVVRSLCARCELLSEDIDLLDEMSEYGRIFDTPVRVFSPVGSNGAELCDYMFQDEKVEEVLDRIKELTDIAVSAETLQMDCERPARDNDWVTASSSEYNLNTPEEDLPVSVRQSRSTVVLSMVASGMVAAAAAVLSYVYMGET